MYPSELSVGTGKGEWEDEMALGVDLFGLDAGGAVIWQWMCRHWDGRNIQKVFADRLKPVEPDPAWECKLTRDEVRELSDQFDPPGWRRWYPEDRELAELLQTPGTEEVLLRIEEWGYG